MLRGLEKSTVRSHVTSRNEGSRKIYRNLEPHWELEVWKRAECQGKQQRGVGAGECMRETNRTLHLPSFHLLAEPRGWFQSLVDVGIDQG